jgi:hypothetical protein
MGVMEGSTLILVAMVAMMVLMCGGMLFGGGWAALRRWKQNRDVHEPPAREHRQAGPPGSA